jgi:hypothetical protein
VLTIAQGDRLFSSVKVLSDKYKPWQLKYSIELGEWVPVLYFYTEHSLDFDEKKLKEIMKVIRDIDDKL